MSEIAGISFFNFYFDPPRKEMTKDNRKNLKEGFVYSSTTKEKPEKNNSKASLPGSQSLSRRLRE